MQLINDIASNITRMVVDIGVNTLGWHDVRTLTPFREVLQWATDAVVNGFLAFMGYTIRFPGPPDYIPVQAVFPPMLPTAYAMGCYDLTAAQISILGDDAVGWKVNDGIVNTASMKGPLNRIGDSHNERNKPLIEHVMYFPHHHGQSSKARGIYWHFGTISGLDHADEIGVFIEDNAVRSLNVIFFFFIVIING